MVSRSVVLGVGHPFHAHKQMLIFSCLTINFLLLHVRCPLWREDGSVVFSFCRASPAQYFLDLSPTGLMSIFYCLYFLYSPNLEGQVPVCISPRNRVAQLYSRAYFKFKVDFGKAEARHRKHKLLKLYSYRAFLLTCTLFHCIFQFSSVQFSSALSRTGLHQLHRR
jgi:hypothetical protein